MGGRDGLGHVRGEPGALYAACELAARDFVTPSAFSVAGCGAARSHLPVHLSNYLRVSTLYSLLKLANKEIRKPRRLSGFHAPAL